MKTMVQYATCDGNKNANAQSLILQAFIENYNGPYVTATIFIWDIF